MEKNNAYLTLIIFTAMAALVVVLIIFSPNRLGEKITNIVEKTKQDHGKFIDGSVIKPNDADKKQFKNLEFQVIEKSTRIVYNVHKVKSKELVSRGFAYIYIPREYNLQSDIFETAILSRELYEKIIESNTELKNKIEKVDFNKIFIGANNE